jgi:hypothetical protein
MMRHTPPDQESRKFDIHACFAGMNIKFPFFSCGQQSAHTQKCGLLLGKYQKAAPKTLPG